MGLRFGAEKALKLENLRQRLQGKRDQAIQTCSGDCTTTEKDHACIEGYLVGKGAVRGRNSAQYVGFLGMLASIGMVISIDLISKMIGKGLPCLY